MFRSVVVIGFWVVTLCIFSIKITFVDGLEISLKGWPDALRDFIKSKNA